MRSFTAFLDRPRDAAIAVDLRRFPLDQHRRTVDPVTINVAVSALRFLFTMMLAAVDRLVHHATIFEMNVESYRRRTAQARRTGPGRPANFTTPKVLEAVRDNQDDK